MTSSFVAILSRHTGPYKLYINFHVPEGTKKKDRDTYAGQWWPEKTKDPVEDAYKMLAPGIRAINVWSCSEECFVLTVMEEDRPTWEREREGWMDTARAMRKEAAPVVVLRLQEGTSPETVRKVLALRAGGMGYVAIDREFGIEGKKGWWSWKIVKVASAMKEVR